MQGFGYQLLVFCLSLGFIVGFILLLVEVHEIKVHLKHIAEKLENKREE